MAGVGLWVLAQRAAMWACWVAGGWLYSSSSKPPTRRAGSTCCAMHGDKQRTQISSKSHPARQARQALLLKQVASGGSGGGGDSGSGSCDRPALTAAVGEADGVVSVGVHTAHSGVALLPALALLHALADGAGGLPGEAAGAAGGWRDGGRELR